MAELEDSLNRIAQSDLNYFTWFPHRKHRVRVADSTEIELAELLGEDMSLPIGKQHYMAIRRDDPTGCLRLPVTGPANAEPGLFNERLAQAIFEEMLNADLPVHPELLFETIKARK
jgi:hypothetical protein